MLKKIYLPLTICASLYFTGCGIFDIAVIGAKTTYVITETSCKIAYTTVKYSTLTVYKVTTFPFRIFDNSNDNDISEGD